MISIRNVCKRFGAQVVLDGVSLEIENGRTLAIVGPSGVGKSVLLKLIIGILSPDSGEIYIFGENMSRARSERERNRIRASMGVLFQAAALFDSLTVYENIAFALIERTNMKQREIHAKVVEMLQAFGLEPYAALYPEQIPIGTRKRVGLARCLITEPKILLFDEPNTGLDPLIGQEVYDLINSCRAKWGFGGVVVSHELPEVFQVSDRVAMLLQGRIVMEGTPKDFVESENPAVQQFLYGRTHGPIQIQ